MRTYDEYRQILELWSELKNKKAIARITGIPRGTVADCINRYGSVDGLEQQRERARKSTPQPILSRIQQNDKLRQSYAYLLGIYLGDGYINLMGNKRVYRLRVSLDKRYPRVIQRCVDAIQCIRSRNKVSVIDEGGYVTVSCYYKFWSVLFPQDGDGPKHERRIILADWQQRIVDEFPLAFFRGLYHSDGSRSRNVVNGTNYPRYMFTNTSHDILELFKQACDRIDVHWTYKGPYSGNSSATIFISRRDDVARLDRLIGPKS